MNTIATLDVSGFLGQMVGYINIFAGLLLTASIISFVGGLGNWFMRLARDGRMVGLSYMIKGTTMLFWLIVMLLFVQIIQTRHALLMVIFGGFLIYIVFYLVREMGRENKLWK